MGVINGFSTINTGDIIEVIKGVTLGIILVFIGYFITKYFWKVLVNYLNWNITIYKKGKWNERSIYFLLLIFSVILVSCSNSNNDNHIKKKNEEKIVEKPLPKRIFNKKTSNQYITENEMKKSIKLYLDKDEELSESSEYYEDKVDSEESLSQSEIKNLKHLNSLRQKNDMNFKNYIINNKLPKDYKKIQKE